MIREGLRCLFLPAALWLSVMAARIDMAEKRIPDRLPVYMALLGVVALWLFPEHGFADRLAGTALISFPMFLLALILEGAFGGGDVKLMAAGGFLLGWRGVALAALTGMVTGGIYCIVMLAVGRLGRKDRIAFGPFLSLGLSLALLVEYAGKFSGIVTEM